MKQVIKKYCTNKKAIALFTIVVICLIFQAGHFFEHLYQASVWLSGIQDEPHMTPIGMWAMHMIGMMTFPNVHPNLQELYGFQLLHLIGNGIFLAGIIGLLFFQRTKLIWTAFYFELFHFYEHVCLTMSSFVLHKPVGMSTAYGYTFSPWANTAILVWWHFIFNLIPSVLIAIAVYKIYTSCTQSKKKKRKRST